MMRTVNFLELLETPYLRSTNPSILVSLLSDDGVVLGTTKLVDSCYPERRSVVRSPVWCFTSTEVSADFRNSGVCRSLYVASCAYLLKRSPNASVYVSSQQFIDGLTDQSPFVTRVYERLIDDGVLSIVYTAKPLNYAPTGEYVSQVKVYRVSPKLGGKF